MYCIPDFFWESLCVYVQKNIICPEVELQSINSYHWPNLHLRCVISWLIVSPTDELNYINLNVAGKCKDKVPRDRGESPEGG
jgi:hypothetical protein